MTGRGPGYALLALAALLAAMAVTSAWSGASRLAGRGEDGAARAAADAAAVEAAASAFVSAYGGFDYRDADSYTARLAALTAGELRAALAGAAVDPAAIAGGRRSRAAVQSVSVEALSGRRRGGDGPLAAASGAGWTRRPDAPPGKRSRSRSACGSSARAAAGW